MELFQGAAEPALPMRPINHTELSLGPFGPALSRGVNSNPTAPRGVTAQNELHR